MGNAGSGKSTLAKAFGLPHLPLDEIAWNEGVERKPLADSLALLEEFVARSDWVVEGCYGDLLAAALPHCDELHFLNPGVEVCVRHCQQRPWEPTKFPSSAAQQAMLAPLISWVRDYDRREDECGLRCHRALFDGFAGTKYEYFCVADYPRPSGRAMRS